MHFIHITGMPRSGTTYMQECLLNTPSCCGLNEEQGLDYIWDSVRILDKVNYDYVNSILERYIPNEDDIIRNGLKEIRFVKRVQWMGTFVWKNLKTLKEPFLDHWCEAACTKDAKFYIHKTPTFKLIKGWPHKFISKSKLFDNYTVIMMLREPEDVIESGYKHFPYWKNITKERLYEIWLEMYKDIDKLPPSWIFVRFSDLRTNLKGTLNALSDKIGLPNIPNMHFRTNTSCTQTWLDDKMKEQVKEILASDRILKPIS
ncbi:Sulfotransferase [Candidatus Magnetoovum chiemensis]|nr:Sulfotransferase [Candidatus Magnetoovum chiemensis]